MEIKPGTIFRQGEIAQFYVVDNRVFLGKSDGISPIGMVVRTFADGSKLSFADPYVATDAEIEFRPCSGKTDLYDTEVSYSVNDNLYSSKNGLFTTKSGGDGYYYTPCVGMVVEPPTAADPALKFVWF